MQLSFAALWEWTRLFVRAPATAARMVKAAGLPVEASVLMIVLAGVLSGVASGVLEALVPSPPMVWDMADGTTVTFTRGGPLQQGFYAVLSGLALAGAVFWVGRRMGGMGSLAQIFAVVAVLQMVMTVILLGQTLAILLAPIFGLFVLLFGLYVFFRGLGHAVNEGHGFGDMGRSILVIVLSILVVCAMAFVGVLLFGLGPDAVVGEVG